MKALLRLYSGSIQALLRLYYGNIEALFRLYYTVCYLLLQALVKRVRGAEIEPHSIL